MRTVPDSPITDTPTSYYNGTRWAFDWSDGRKLICAESADTELSFEYDQSGVRTSKTVDGVVHHYTYASGKLLRETYGSTVLDFFYDSNGRPYAFKYNGTLYYYVLNLQGDVIRLVSTTGTTIQSYSYNAWGELTNTVSSKVGKLNPLRYRGYYYDSELEMYYLQTRYYDPVICRFINADSFASTGQGFLGYNMFAYCGNNPVIASDPTGEAFFLVTAAIGAVAGAIYGGIKAAQSGKSVLSGIALGAAVGGAVGLGFGAAAGVLLAGSAVASTASVAIGVKSFAATVSTSGVIAGGLMLADNVTQALKHAPQVFWSGGNTAMNAARSLAESLNGITLEMTHLGQYLEQMPFNRDAWAAASQNFANVASNVASAIHVVHNAAGVGIDSIWATIEYPLLKTAELIYHVAY